ncbi:MAG: hypothetical protein ACI841_003213 [Planctomycetota bacterium]
MSAQQEQPRKADGKRSILIRTLLRETTDLVIEYSIELVQRLMERISNSLACVLGGYRRETARPSFDHAPGIDSAFVCVLVLQMNIDSCQPVSKRREHVFDTRLRIRFESGGNFEMRFVDMYLHRGQLSVL